MISLFIDTSVSNVTIALVRDMEVVSIIQEDISYEHSKYATSFVKKVIDDALVDANDIDKIYVVNGPGSFTGVRIGVTIAKTYGYLINKNIIAVSSLKGLAISSNVDDVIMSVISANKSSYYVSIYDSNYNNVINEECVSRDKLLELINKYNVKNIVSNDFNVIGIHKLMKVKLDVLKIIDYYKNIDGINYYALVPNYLKLPQAMESK